ncbi:MAG TPA: DMT family transporter [bacterium]|nr:DMT family transporter [bacterium]
MLLSDLGSLTSALALLAALCFAAGTLLAKRGLQHLDSITGAVVQIAVSLLAFVLAAPFSIESGDWLSPAVWVFAGIGLLRPSLSTMLAFEGNRRLGPTITATVASLSPIFAVTGGVLFLAERLTLPIVIGTVGVVLGVGVLSSKGRLPRSWPVWALLFPLGAALIRSSAHVGAKWGLLILPNVVMSGLVAYSVSFAVALGVRLLRGQRMGPQPPVTRTGAAWFVASGLTNAAAIFLLNSALMLGQVVYVSPVVAAYPVFTMLGSWLFYRQETITGRMVLGLLLIVPSVVVITLAH